MIKKIIDNSPNDFLYSFNKKKDNYAKKNNFKVKVRKNLRGRDTILSSRQVHLGNYIISINKI